jgi:hypothetical protein
MLGLGSAELFDAVAISIRVIRDYPTEVLANLIQYFRATKTAARLKDDLEKYWRDPIGSDAAQAVPDYEAARRAAAAA